MDNQVKALSKTDTELRVGNYIVLFGGKDLEGDTFTAKTLLESSYTKSGVLHVDFEHGRDPDKMGIGAHDVLGTVDWKTARIDENGVFVERVLNRQARYMKYIEQLIDAGVVGTSSQAVSGKVRKAANGELEAWPLMRDSLTVTPMEPRMVSQNVLIAAKSLLNEFPDSEALQNLATACPIEKSARIADIQTVRDFDEYLRDVGHSKGAAEMLIAKAKTIFVGDPREEDKAALLKRILYS